MILRLFWRNLFADESSKEKKLLFTSEARKRKLIGELETKKCASNASLAEFLLLRKEYRDTPFFITLQQGETLVLCGRHNSRGVINSLSDDTTLFNDTLPLNKSEKEAKNSFFDKIKEGYFSVNFNLFTLDEKNVEYFPEAFYPFDNFRIKLKEGDSVVLIFSYLGGREYLTIKDLKFS